MPIQPIGDYNLRIAELEAQGIEKQSDNLRGLSSDISGVMDSSLRGAEVLQQQAIKEQKEKEAKELLLKGADGVKLYTSELGFDQNTSNMFYNMAKQVKDPSEIQKIYGMAKTKADKDAIANKRTMLLSGAKDSIIKLRANPNATIEDYRKFTSGMEMSEIEVDKDTALQINRLKDDVMKEADRRFGQKDTEKPDSFKKVKSNLDLTRAEMKEFNDQSKESKIVKRQTMAIKTAINTAVERVQRGKDPDNAVLDQVLGTGLQKILDPTSVVRESEFNRLGMGQAFVNMMRGKFESLSKGGLGLTDEARARVAEFAEDMAELANNEIRKNMLTFAVRSDFNNRYDLKELDATLFNDNEVEKMKMISEGKKVLSDELEDRIKRNVQWFIENPNIISEKTSKPVKYQKQSNSSDFSSEDISKMRTATAEDF